MQQSADLPQGIDLSLPVMEGLARAWHIGGMQKKTSGFRRMEGFC